MSVYVCMYSTCSFLLYKYKYRLQMEQVDITISKNQALQILYLAYSTVLQC